MKALAAGVEGKGVIVTGAAGGIGRVVAQEFAEAGARVLVTDIREDSLKEVFDSLPGEGHDWAACDLRDFAAVEALVPRAIERLGGLRVLVLSAALVIRRWSPPEVLEADWDAQMDVNVKANFWLARAGAEAMKKAGDGGRIIAFTSQAWWTGGLSGTHIYATTKGALVSMCRGFARAYGPDGITVNTICPGVVATDINIGMEPEKIKAMEEGTVVKRMATPEEMAGTVLFLASDSAAYITGATVNLTGGFLMY